MIITNERKPIRMYRGDTFISSIKINLGDHLYPEIYYLQDSDKLYVGLTEPGKLFEQAILKKTLTLYTEKDLEGNVILTIKPEDTEYLVSSQYYLCCKLYRVVDGVESVITVIPPTMFFIM